MDSSGEKIKDLLDECERYNLEIGNALSTSAVDTVRDDEAFVAGDPQRKTFHGSMKYADPDERQDILQWLSPFDFRSRRNDMLKNCCMIGQRFRTSPEFKNWRSGRHWHLKCYGAPGSGKVRLLYVQCHSIGDDLAFRQSLPLLSAMSWKTRASQTTSRW